MNKFPLIEMVAFFCRYSVPDSPAWRKKYVHHLKKVRSSHTKKEGGIRKCYYSVETKAGDIINLEYNLEELCWELEASADNKNKIVDRVLAYIKRHKHLPSESHRIIPLRFEIFPRDKAERKTPIDLALIDRMQPYRFIKHRGGSTQVQRIETRHMENTMITKHLHYVTEDTDQLFYHLVYILDECDWRFMQEVDEQFLFVR